MTPEQLKLVSTSKSKPKLASLGLVALFAVGLLVRLDARNIIGDMSKYYFNRYQNIMDNGLAASFLAHFTDYTPAFWYLFAGTTLFDTFFQ